jgi:hypothetical protein
MPLLSLNKHPVLNNLIFFDTSSRISRERRRRLWTRHRALAVNAGGGFCHVIAHNRQTNTYYYCNGQDEANCEEVYGG